ncbi:transposase [Candidatus Saccharibacteria bacterium]|nr:transposase [Candidatus Saccharibacteria bacterium]
MPSKNIEKIYLPDTYYHVYNRGVNKRRIFIDDEDYCVFLNLLKRYLSNEPQYDKKRREYPWLHNDIELLAYCLMPNHFHLLLYQQSEKSMTALLRGVCTAYTGYFNKKYGRVGHLFQDRFKASMITTDGYLQHISRYIHLNPRDYTAWTYSSYPYYLADRSAAWIKPDKIMALFPSKAAYEEFVHDYADYKRSLDEIGSELANT